MAKEIYDTSSEINISIDQKSDIKKAAARLHL